MDEPEDLYQQVVNELHRLYDQLLHLLQETNKDRYLEALTHDRRRAIQILWIAQMSDLANRLN